MALPERVVRRWREQVHAAAVAARAAAEAAADAGVGARSLQLLHESPADGAAPASARLRQRVRRYVDPAAGTRAGLAHIDARPPDTTAALQLYECRTSDVFLPGDALDAHRACRWP